MTQILIMYANQNIYQNNNNIIIVMMIIIIYIYIKNTKFLWKDLGWIIDSVIDHTINILKYKPWSGINYIKIPKEIDHPGKGLINIQNIDNNECLKW